MEKRERKRIEPIKKGIPIASIGADVIWDDEKLRVPFSSNPFISRMKGKAELQMALSFGLYYNELTKKWSPITSTTMTEALIKARYYPTPPDPLTELSDNKLRTNDEQELMVVNKDVPLAVSDLAFDVSDNLKVVNKDVPLKVSDLAFLETTKLSVKDASAVSALDAIKLNQDAIKLQTDKLQFDLSNNLKCFYAL